jgi:outer membrane protein insertion porin family
MPPWRLEIKTYSPGERVEAMLKKILSIVALAMLCAVPGNVHAAGGVRVCILPFTVNSQDTLDYLSRALPDMVATRLEKPGEIIVVPKPVVAKALVQLGWKGFTEQAARAVGRSVGADFVVGGTLTKIGKAASIDAAIIDMSGKRPLQRVYLTADDTAELPGSMQDLARRLSFVILNRELVADVIISGNKFIEKDAVLYVMQTKKGEPYSPDVVQEDLKKVYEMGYFKDIQISTQDVEGGKEVTFTVVEKPMIRAVQINGTKNLKIEDIQKVMEVKPRTILDVNKVVGDVGRIKKAYMEKGYYNAEITYRVNPLDEDFASVDFDITENKIVKVKDVTFSGNDSIKASELRGILETRKKHWLMSWFTTVGIFKDESLEKDVERLTAYYYSKGFLTVKVDKPTIDFKDDGIYVHFNLTEGDRFTVGTIEFKGDLIYPPEVLESKVKILSGQVFNGRTLNDDLVALKGVYSEKGFAYADVSPLTDIVAEEKKVNIIFAIDRGDKIFIEEIRVTGNTRTRDNVIRRELRLLEGGVYNSEEIKRGKQDINKLGYFEEVNINTEPGSNPRQVKLHVEVKERPTGSFSIGAGYSSADSVMGMFSISQNNLFGKGQQLSFMAQIGGQSSYYNISFTEPWYKDSRISVGFDLFNIKREYEDFDRDSFGFNLRAGCPFFKYDYTRFNITYRLEVIDIKLRNNDNNVEVYNYNDEKYYYGDGDEVPLEIQKSEGKTVISSIINSITRDTRDDKFNPRTGHMVSGSAELAGFGGDARFLGLNFTAAKWFPLFWDTAFMMRGTIGEYFPLGEDIPISEKYFLGGIDSMRGFEARTLAPMDRVPKGSKNYYIGDYKISVPQKGYSDDYDPVGGEKAMFYNFEYLFPIMKDAGIRGVVFTDIGNSYRRSETFFSDLRYDVGIGVRWYSPFGPLRVEWGYNPAPKSKYDESSSNFEFSMGNTF